MTNFEYMSVQQIVQSEQFPFSLGQVRNFLVMRHKNGLAAAVRKIGRRLYLRRDLFEQWIESQSQSSRGGRP